MLISEQQLRDWLGYRRRADLERALREQGIRYVRGRGGAICTCAEWLRGPEKARETVEFKDG